MMICWSIPSWLQIEKKPAPTTEASKLRLFSSATLTLSSKLTGTTTRSPWALQKVKDVTKTLNRINACFTLQNPEIRKL